MVSGIDEGDDDDADDELELDDEEEDPGEVGDALTGPVQPISTMGLIVTGMLGLNAVASLVGIWTFISQLGLLEELDTGAYVSDLALEQNDSVVQLVALLTVGLFVLTAIAYMVWMHRAYKNLAAFAYAPAHGTGWAIGAWIVPILNLFRPFQMVREIHTYSDPDRRFGEHVGPQATLPMGVWWATWVVANILGRIEARMPVDTLPELTFATQVSIGSSLVSCVCAVLAAVVVHQATQRQAALIKRLGGGPDPTTF